MGFGGKTVGFGVKSHIFGVLGGVLGYGTPPQMCPPPSYGALLWGGPSAIRRCFYRANNGVWGEEHGIWGGNPVSLGSWGGFGVRDPPQPMCPPHPPPSYGVLLWGGPSAIRRCFYRANNGVSGEEHGIWGGNPVSLGSLGGFWGTGPPPPMCVPPPPAMGCCCGSCFSGGGLWGLGGVYGVGGHGIVGAQ